MRSSLLLLLLALSLHSGALPAQEPPGSTAREISPGVFEIGSVRLEQTTRQITFPAAVNLTKGMLEYLLVHKNGPSHESLLITEVPPSDLHLAMLLLGAKGGGQKSAAAPGQITAEYLKKAPALLGEPITLTVVWKDAAGAEKSAPAEDWLARTDSKKPVERGPWTYSGSMFGEGGHFMATSEGLFAALVTNPSALINNPRKGHESDQVWEVNEKTVPPSDTPVVVRLTLQAPAPAPAAP